MAEFLSGGVFIEEVASQVQVIPAVSTSTMGIAGFTPQGPTDEATLVSSFDDFTNKFGSIVANSFLGLTMAAFFSNGGKRAYVVRVLPSDAVAASAELLSTETDQQIETGDGVTAAFSKTATTTTLHVNAGASPIVPGTMALRWRAAASNIAAPGVALQNRDESAAVALQNAVAAYEARIDTKAQLTVPGTATPAGDILYRSRGDERTDITIAHVNDGPNTGIPSVTVLGTAITVHFSSVPTITTAAQVVTAIANTPAAAALVTASVVMAGNTAAIAATPLAGGTCSFDQALDMVVRGTVGVIWNPDGVGDREMTIPSTLSPNLGGEVPQYTAIQTAGGGVGNIQSGDLLVIDDGIHNPTTFEFTTSSPAPGHVGIVFTALDSATTMQGHIVTAINNVGPTLDVTAVASFTNRVLLSHDLNGTITLSDTIANPGALVIGTVFRFDHRSGFLSINFADTDIPDGSAVGDLRAAYTPTTAPIVSGNRTSFSAIDDGLGHLTSSSIVGLGAIDYDTGAYSFTTTVSATPHNLARILLSYTISDWTLQPISKGAWGNNLQLSVRGNSDFFNAATATYSQFDVLVSLFNAASGKFVVQETFEELDFSTPGSSNFWADVVNEMSDFVRVIEPGGNEPVNQLNGVPNFEVLGGGDGGSPGRTFALSLDNSPVGARSLSITYTDTTGTVQTVSDDGNGNLTGSIDVTQTNTIVYPTGALSVTLLNPIKAGTLVTASYRTAVTETLHSETFGDTTKGYTPGSDGTFTATTYGRNQFTNPLLIPVNKGVFALNLIDEILQVVLPDFAGDVTITGDLLDYADARAGQPAGGDRFIILTTPKGQSAQQAVDWFRFSLGRYSKFAALYWPWVKVANPLSALSLPLTMPALGHIAGVYARTDTNKNVGKSPGGTVDGALTFLTGLEVNTTQGDRDLVYPNKINPLINNTQTGGPAVWGVRTIASPSDSDWRYINARRLFMFLEKSIFNATFWIVFENNGPGLWSRIASQLNGFLSGLFSQGYFAGTTPQEAFFVTVDNTNNTPDTINQGLVFIDVGVAVNKPAEFVVFRFRQITA